MTPEEWMRKHFSMNDGDGTFNWGAANRNGITAVFLSCFGDTIQSALDGSQNPVDALIALPDADKRGWGPDFSDWKNQGI